MSEYDLMVLVLGGVIWFLAWSRHREQQEERLRRENEKLRKWEEEERRATGPRAPNRLPRRLTLAEIENLREHKRATLAQLREQE